MKQHIDKQNEPIKNNLKEKSDWLSQVQDLSDEKADRLNGGRGLLNPATYDFDRT